MPLILSTKFIPYIAKSLFAFDWNIITCRFSYVLRWNVELDLKSLRIKNETLIKVHMLGLAALKLHGPNWHFLMRKPSESVVSPAKYTYTMMRCVTVFFVSVTSGRNVLLWLTGDYNAHKRDFNRYVIGFVHTLMHTRNGRIMRIGLCRSDLRRYIKLSFVLMFIDMRSILST